MTTGNKVMTMGTANIRKIKLPQYRFFFSISLGKQPFYDLEEKTDHVNKKRGNKMEKQNLNVRINFGKKCMTKICLQYVNKIV